jgi:hypothetical protein
MSHRSYKHNRPVNKEGKEFSTVGKEFSTVGKEFSTVGKEFSIEEKQNQTYNILNELKDYMFDYKNLRLITKHNIDFVSLNDISISKNNKQKDKNKEYVKSSIIKKDTTYKPTQKDSLFWCFYIIKYGFSKYEMEIGNQHFVIEKQEKIKYIEMLRENKYKDILKTHKIKPLTSIEDNLANHDRISIKTFFALCVIENINIILIDKRKLYETIMTDDLKIHVIQRNSLTHENYIELDVLPESINTYRETYYKMTTFDVSLKTMASYKLDELLELCKKLNIDTKPDTNNKKVTKKDIYELLVLNF